ncbi:MAG: hypothetical protein AB1345_15010 [Chloroflexota bacterium]
MNSLIPSSRRISRRVILDLIRTALNVKSLRFAQQVALHWLAAYPGDLEVQYLHSQALVADGQADQALVILEEICKRDAEYSLAHLARARAAEQNGQSNLLALWGVAAALENSTVNRAPLPPWSQPLHLAREALNRGDLEAAETQLQPALANELPTSLAAVTHLRLLLARQTSPHAPSEELRNLAALYHQRWPDCLACTLVYADTLMDGGKSEQAVALMHQAASQDVAGQVASRLWGTTHPYHSLWPDLEGATEETSIQSLGMVIPAEVSAALGWNQLPEAVSEAGQGSETPSDSTSQAKHPRVARVQRETTPPGRRPPSSSTSDEYDSEIQEIYDELARLAAHIKRPHLALVDGRFPVYIVLSTRRGLESQYGVNTADEIIRHMQDLVEAIDKGHEYDALLLLADDPENTAEVELKPAKPDDPWAIKLLLTDLEEKLRKQGRMIGALLIVGGSEVVPFHLLPNPLDDDDPEVPSDNPYSTRDENYFVSEWPTGRLPGGSDSDPGLLLQNLRKAIQYHRGLAKTLPWYQRLRSYLKKALSLHKNENTAGFGYSAAIWQRASLAVFRLIGEPRSLWISPPRASDDASQLSLPLSHLSYYNLHGEVDAIEWFGQRDPLELSEGPDYPIALRPQDIPNGGGAPKVVFSEACYGAHILGKRVEEAIALTFLACGTHAVVGSTVASYGSVAPPLFAADLLGQAFWHLVQDGLPVGPALQQAKIYLARKMHHLQGYLDGEDQKSLISFVLYGDPLYRPKPNGRNGSVKTRLRRTPLEVKTVCDRTNRGTKGVVSKKVLTQVKNIVEHYLPGAQDAEVTISEEHVECQGRGHTCPTSQMGHQAYPGHTPNRKVITLHTKVTQAKTVHRHYARVTVDKQGKIVKLAVSR